MSDRGAWYVVVQTVLMLAALLAPVAGLRAGEWPAPVAVVGGVLVLGGLGVAALASVTLGRSLSPFPKPNARSTLVEHGVFSVVRHPIYGGIVLIALGWSLVWGSLATAVGALVLLAFFDIKARREEGWLEARFPGYAAYKGRVRKLIPFVY